VQRTPDRESGTGNVEGSNASLMRCVHIKEKKEIANRKWEGQPDGRVKRRSSGAKKVNTEGSVEVFGDGREHNRLEERGLKVDRGQFGKVTKGSKGTAPGVGQMGRKENQVRVKEKKPSATPIGRGKSSMSDLWSCAGSPRLESRLRGP